VVVARLRRVGAYEPPAVLGVLIGIDAAALQALARAALAVTP